MRRRRRVLVVLFVFSAFIAPLGFFYLTITNDYDNINYFDEAHGNARLLESEDSGKSTVDFQRFSEAECSTFPSNISREYAECLSKMSWIQNGWKTHSCYAENLVDGTECSFRYYLSQVEHYCPPMNNSERILKFAKIIPNIQRLLPIFERIPQYMKDRINRLWKKWEEGSENLLENYKKSVIERKELNILVFIGFLANEQKLKFAKKSDHGGPLGELLQWSDLLAVLSIIGHHLEVSTDKSSLRNFISKYLERGPCQSINGKRQQLDIIFTDIMGLNILKQQHRQFLLNHRCRIRLLDSFGTHAEFTTQKYFLEHKIQLSGSMSQRNPWGGHGLDLRQHWTFYPHSDDNTFLGFVVDTEGIDEKKQKTSIPSALVYGKEQYMWRDMDIPIRTLKRLVNVHSTVADLDGTDGKKSSIFENVQNHGLLSSREISHLLDNTTIFFGLGFPLEGPAPLEAMAHGAVFINAKFKEPKSRKNYKFLAEKPTLREFTSQNPYMERIGEPHVITVDINNEEELENAIKKAALLKPKPFVPMEFTPAGMLLRVALLLEKQEFCDKIPVSKRWPPRSNMKIFKSSASTDSCEMVCHSHSLICEPSYFPFLNSPSRLKREFSCSTVSPVSSPFAPFNCTTQKSASLFSCASRPDNTSNIFRLCPCRDYIPQQYAICTNCL